MSMTLNRPAYKGLLKEDLGWLEKQPRTLEREHIAALLRDEIKELSIYKRATKIQTGGK